MDVDAVCKLADAHMRYVGVEVEGRACGHVQKEGDSLRLGIYYVPKVKGQLPPGHPDLKPDEQGGEFDAYNFCLWPREDDQGWQVGYSAEGVLPCRFRDDYCKLGAGPVKLHMSPNGCPGDAGHVDLRPEAVRKSLVGEWHWVGEAPVAHSLTVADGGVFDLKAGDGSVKGQWTLNSAFQIQVNGAERRSSLLGFALVDDVLYLGRGPVTRSKTPEAFALDVGGGRLIRRFRGACYDIVSPPRDAPLSFECAIKTVSGEQTVELIFDERSVRLHRVGDYWLSTEVRSSTFERRATPPPTGK